MKPVHTAWMSKAGQPWMLRRSWSRQAVLGNMRSGVVVATMIRSIWSLSTPAAAIACRAACSARSQVVSSSAATRRSRIPVRSVIH